MYYVFHELKKMYPPPPKRLTAPTLKPWAAIPGGGRGTRPPNIFWGGDGYGSVPPSHWLLHAPVLYALTRIHKDQHTLSTILQDTQETLSTIFVASHCNTWLNNRNIIIMVMGLAQTA